MSVKVFAKANISLEVKGVREDGFHDLDMLLCSVDIFDKVSFCEAQGISVVMDGVVQDEKNTAYRALAMCVASFGLKGGVIQIEKGIPFEAGLGGSSADASATLYILQKLYNLDGKKIFEIASRVGSDVALMMKGGLLRAEGKGEILTPLAYREFCFVVAKPGGGVSTPKAFNAFDGGGVSVARTAVLVDKIINNDDFAGAMKNDLTESAIQQNPKIKSLLAQMSAFSDKCVMSGSGSAVIGVFENIQTAKACEDALNDCEFKRVVFSQPYGIEII